MLLLSKRHLSTANAGHRRHFNVAAVIAELAAFFRVVDATYRKPTDSTRRSYWRTVLSTDGDICSSKCYKIDVVRYRCVVFRCHPGTGNCCIIDWLRDWLDHKTLHKCLANAKRPCDCRVLCLHLKSSLSSCAHSVSDMTSFCCRDQGSDSAHPVLWMPTWRNSRKRS